MLKEALVPAVATLHVAAGAVGAFGQGHATERTQPDGGMSRILDVGLAPLGCAKVVDNPDNPQSRLYHVCICSFIHIHTIYV